MGPHLIACLSENVVTPWHRRGGERVSGASMCSLDLTYDLLRQKMQKKVRFAWIFFVKVGKKLVSKSVYLISVIECVWQVVDKIIMWASLKWEGYACFKGVTICELAQEGYQSCTSMRVSKNQGERSAFHCGGRGRTLFESYRFWPDLGVPVAQAQRKAASVANGTGALPSWGTTTTIPARAGW